MSETPNGQEVPLTINAQYIKDLSFELPDALKSFQESREAPNIEVGVNVNVAKQNDLLFEITLQISINATRGNSTLFILELTYGGLFTLSSSVPTEAINPILLIECPRLLFPFARAVISNVSREAGFPALTLNPIDFLELYKRQAAGMKEESTEAAAEKGTTKSTKK